MVDDAFPERRKTCGERIGVLESGGDDGEGGEDVRELEERKEGEESASRIRPGEGRRGTNEVRV